MLQSHLFIKTSKSAPADEETKNAQLLVRGGFIHKEMAGVYMLLPMGLRIIEKLKGIIREEMNAMGSQEILTTTLQRKELWERTDRWDDKKVDIWFKSELRSGGEVGLAWSHEEPIADMMKNHINSHKDLPTSVYQFQNKLRNELRAKAGLMRGREFLMKDMYSFAADEKQHDAFYEASKTAYMNVFKRVGLGDDTYITHAAGGAFTEFSHEFQTVCEAGEDTIYVHKKKNFALNKEIANKKVLDELGVTLADLEEVASAEVGNIFNFGRQKAKDVGLFFTDTEGKKEAVWMGSYGIGVTRLAAVLVEKFNDDRGIIWPDDVAPFLVHVVGLDLEDDAVRKNAHAVYETLRKQGIEVLFDDRLDARPGEKLGDSDLFGIPWRIVVSKRTEKSIELKKRSESKAAVMNLASAIKKISS